MKNKKKKLRKTNKNNFFFFNYYEILKFWKFFRKNPIFLMSEDEKRY